MTVDDYIDFKFKVNDISYNELYVPFWLDNRIRVFLLVLKISDYHLEQCSSTFDSIKTAYDFMKLQHYHVYGRLPKEMDKKNEEISMSW